MNPLPRLTGLLGPALLLTLSSCTANLQSDEDAIDPHSVATQAQPLWSVNNVWPSGDIKFCWDSSTNAFPQQRAWVVEAFEATWGRAGHVAIYDGGNCEVYRVTKCPIFGPCPVLRITFADSTTNPNTDVLGYHPDGSVMTLNPTFNNWSPAFCAGTKSEYCFRAIAAHEFGHVLGFSHEQNRSDKDINCTVPAQGPDGATNLTPYDPSSIMNYCATWNGTGELSALDESGLRAMYGGRTVPLFFYDCGTALGSYASLDTDANYLLHRTAPGFQQWARVTTTGNKHLFFYNARGEAAVVRVRYNGQSVQIGGTLTGFASWSDVVASGRKNLFFYNRDTGVGSVGQIYDDGTYHDVSSFAVPKLNLVTGLRNGHVFMLNPVTGVGTIAFIDQQGQYTVRGTVPGVARNWTAITGVDSDVLFFYDQPNRAGATATIDGTGQYVFRKSLVGFGDDWSHVVGASNGALFFYNQYTGMGAAARIDAVGNYTYSGRNAYPGLAKFWYQITAG